MASTISNFAVSSTGLCTWTNPGSPTNPLRVLNPTRSFTSPNLAATATSYQIPTGDFQAGDKIELQRFVIPAPVVQNTFTATVPSPVVTPAPSLTTPPSVSGTFQVGDTLTATQGVWENETTVLRQWISTTVANQGVPPGTVVGTAQTYTPVAADVGNEITYMEKATGPGGTATDYVWGTTPVVAAVTPPPPPPPPPSGNPTVQFFAPGDPINFAIPTNPVLHTSNATWKSKWLTNVFAAIDTSALYGWPLYHAATTDPVYSIAGGYQTIKCHFPKAAVPSGDADGHLIIVAPTGNTVSEMGAVKISGTWPNQTITMGNDYTATQFNCSPVNGVSVADHQIGGDGTVDGNPGHIGAPGSARGGDPSCLAGLFTQAEFEAALAVENAGGKGLIPHALTASVSFTASTFVYPCIHADGDTAGGIPEGTRLQLDPAFNISGFTAAQRVVLRTLQVFGWYVTDSLGSSGNNIVFEGQVTNGTDSTFAGFDEQNGNTLGGGNLASVWANMRVLNSWNGQ